MPKRAQIPCREPGCKARCNGPYCSAHERNNLAADDCHRRDRERGSAAARGYGRRWQRLREMVLARDPLCKIAILCDGMAPSVDADHILRKPLGDDSMENLQGACHACHSYKTAVKDSNFAGPIQPGGRGSKSSKSFGL